MKKAFLYIICLIPSMLASQLKNLDIYNAKLKFETFKVKEQPISSVDCIFEDSHNFIWLGTYFGLIRLDGNTIERFTYSPTDTQSICDNKVRIIKEDEKNNLWIGTQNGLNYFNTAKNTFTRYINPAVNGIGIIEINDIYIDFNKNVWVGAKDGLYKLSKIDNKFEQIHNLNQLNKSIIINVINGAGDTLFIGTKGGIYVLNTVTNEIDSLFTQLEITSLLINDTMAWIGTTKGLIKYNLVSNNTSYTPILSRINFILSFSKQLLLLGTSNGLIIYSTPTNLFKKYISDPNDKLTLINNNIERGLISSGNLIWLSNIANNMQLLDLNKLKFHNIEINLGETISMVRLNYELLEYAKDTLLIQTAIGPTFLDINNNSKIPFPWKPEFNTEIWDAGIVCYFEQGKDSIWIGANGGLFLFNKKSHEFLNLYLDFPGLKELKGQVVKKILVDKHRTVWIGTWHHGLYRINTENKNIDRFYSKNIDLISLLSNVRTIYETRDSNIWIGTRGGLINYNYKLNAFKVYKHDINDHFSISENTAFRIHEDLQGTIWIATYGGGLNKFNPKTEQFHYILEKDGLTTNATACILYDTDEDLLWIPTSNGLNYFDIQNNKITKYYKNQGLINSFFSTVNSYRSTLSNRLFLGGDNGIDYFEVGSISASKFDPHVKLTQIKLFNNNLGIDKISPVNNRIILTNNISFAKNIDLKYNENMITFDYVALDYSGIENLNYAYKLEGFDTTWQYVDKQRTATFTNLDPGKYTFKVKATNADGVWGTKEARLEINISPPWWRTWWAYLIYFSTIFGTISGYIRYRSRSLRQRNIILEEKVQSRTIELNQSLINLKNTQEKLIQAERDKAERETLRLKQEAAELEMQALRAQMNPHFIFNALNSINNFIQQKEQVQASEYLIKFSKLIRSVLEYTTLPTISLEQELEALKLYIDLESLRFKQKFEYKIEYTEDLDIQSILIPPLLLQPFVENAIYHGLMPKSGPGLLYIGIKENGNSLDIVISDNGIGRIASKQNKSNTDIKHKSMGLTLTIDRIKLFNGNREYKPIEIMDLEDTQGHAQGTKVNINIPIRI